MAAVMRREGASLAKFVSVGLLALGLLLSAAVAHARPPPQPAMLDKFALVKGHGQFRAGGIVVHYQGKPVVVVSSQVLGEQISICDINERGIALSAILFPADATAIVLLELADGASAPSALEIVDVVENFSLDEKVFVYGFDDIRQAIARFKGKIVGIGPDQIEIKATVKSAFRGGVVASADGRMVGFCRANPLPKKGFEVRCWRLDKPFAMIRLTPDQYAAETADLQTLRGRVDAVRQEIDSFAGEVGALEVGGDGERQVSLPKISRLEKRFGGYESMCSSLVDRLRDQAGAKVPYLRSSYDAEIARAEMVLTRLRDCRASLAEKKEGHLKWLRSMKANRKF